MVFSQTGREINNLSQVFKNFGSNYALFNKSFTNIGKDLKNGLGIRSFTNIVSKTDIENFNKFNNALNSGISYSQAFKDNLSKSSTTIQRQALEVQKLRIQQNILNTQRQTGKITEEQYYTAMTANKAKMQALTTQTQSLTLSQKAATVTSKALAISLNLISNIAFVMAINLIITGITKLVNKQKELRESISETAEEAKKQTDSLNSLIKSYEEFAEKIEYTAEEKDKLKDIQDQLSELYHKEVSDIDLVNGKYDEQIEKLKELKREKLKDAELSLVAEREQAKQDSSNKNLINKKFNIQSSWFKSDEEYNEIIQELDKRVNGFTTDAGLFADARINLFSGGAEYRAKEIKEAMAVFKEYGYTNLAIYSKLNDLLSEYQGYVDAENEAISNLAQNIFQQYELDNPYKDVGKDSYLSWKNGLLDSAGSDNELRDELLNLVKKQFPDYTEYFNNLAKARNMFVKANSASDVGYATERDAFLLSLSDEDLEVATKIPDLFADGLEGATKKIEAWKKQNSIETEVKITIDEALEGQTNKIKTITSAMEDMADTGYITSETYAELAKLGGNFTDCLEWENGKLKLNVDKLKDLEIQQLATAKSANSLAISELELKAASLAAHGQDFSDIQAQIESLMKENAVYTQLMEEIANAKPDDKSSSEKSEEPESVTQFKKALAEKEHLLNTNQISEQEYYEWLDSESKRVYGNLADYEEDLWKYEEQVYKWRQEQEQDLFDKKIENYKKLSDNALDKYVDGNGKELTVNASFDYARSQINSAITLTQNRINELSLKKGFEDEIEELTSDLEGLYDTLDDINKQEIESQKEYIQTLKDEYSDLMDEQIDQQKKLSEEIEKSYESRISAIDRQIDAIEKVNEAEERQKSILEAQKKLREAKIKNRIVLGNYGWEAREDKEAVKEAQEDLEKAYQDEQIAKLEEQKELLETQKDNSKEYYDKVVTDLEEQKSAREKQYDILVDIYEQLGGDKKQTSLNESLIAKLTTNGDINKAVQGLTPAELQKAFTSGLLTTDSNGNYTIDYSILDSNSEAVKDNTSALNGVTDVLNQFVPKTEKTTDSTITAGGFNLVADEYGNLTKKPVTINGKVVEGLGQNVKPVTKSEWEKDNKTFKNVGKFAGYDTMKGLLNAIMTGEYTIPTSTANSIMNSNINSRIGKDITKTPDYTNSNINNAPVFNQTFNIDGDATDNTVNKLKNAAREVATEEINSYFQYLNNTMQSTLIKSRYNK